MFRKLPFLAIFVIVLVGVLAINAPPGNAYQVNGQAKVTCADNVSPPIASLNLDMHFALEKNTVVAMTVAENPVAVVNEKNDDADHDGNTLPCRSLAGQDVALMNENYQNTGPEVVTARTAPMTQDNLRNACPTNQPEATARNGVRSDGELSNLLRLQLS